MVIVRDMWLTGFDAPCLHTMYVDKPMQGHGLMQAIARVNRVFKDKPGGLVVDYLGLADSLKKAMAIYTQGRRARSDDHRPERSRCGHAQVVRGLLRSLPQASTGALGREGNRSTGWPCSQAMEGILAIKGWGRRNPTGGADTWAPSTTSPGPSPCPSPMLKPSAFVMTLAFFQAVRAGLIKTTGDGPPPGLIEEAIRQLLSKAIGSGGVVDILKEMGFKRPDLSILSDEFLAEVRKIPEKHLAVEMLRRLLNDEIKARGKKNLVLGRSFTELLEKTILAYRNRSIETVQVLEELIKLAKDFKAASKRGESLGLNEDEVAFYDALETNDSAVAALGDKNLCLIARELVESIHKNVTIDWTVKESVRAKLRLKVKQILKRHGYPPDKQEKATQTVLEQAELIAADWAA